MFCYCISIYIQIIASVIVCFMMSVLVSMKFDSNQDTRQNRRLQEQ